MAYNDSQELSLLSKTELEWLLGKKQISKSFEYKIKSTIKKKINKFLTCELPFFIKSGLIDKQLIQDIIDNPNNNMLLNLGKEKVASPKVWNHTGILAQGFESSLRVRSNKYEENSVKSISTTNVVSNVYD